MSLERKGYHIEPLITEEKIQSVVNRIAEEIAEDYAGQEVLLVGVLKGAHVFTADLERALSKLDVANVQIDFIGVESYGSGMTSSKAPKITHDLTIDIGDTNVILVEDIVDTGYSMQMLLDILKARKPRSLKVAALLSKGERREVEVPIDYLGENIPDMFVVGYGLDYDQRERHLPFIGVVNKR